MRWDYSSDYRDQFDNGPHTDILIVPHATLVTPVPGGPPEVRSKVPEFGPGESGKPIEGKYRPVEFVITNDDIIKEKFEYADSICSSNNLAFGSCEAGMIKFTIRNNKSWNEASQRWEVDIPNLQTLEVISDDGKVLIGEVQGSAIIELYTYINGDSSSLMWRGMYKVEQDKASGDGYEREIIAYDFMQTFREMDIFNWYRSLFDGVPIDSDDWSKGTKTDGKDEWTIGEALNNLLENLCYLSPKSNVGNTITNPKDYLNDMDTDDYPGYGMPIMLDPDLTNPDVAELVIPSDVGEGEHERYGYMPILNLPFRKDEKIIKKGALSFGKMLEDIAMLGGRFGVIRKDIRKQENFHYDKSDTYHYNHYDKCYLTFRGIPKKDKSIAAENKFSSEDVQKGFKFDYYDAKEYKLIDIYDYDGKELIKYCPSGLSEQDLEQYKAGMTYEFEVLLIKDNMFTSYLNEDKEGHSRIIQALKEGATGVYNGKALLKSCFKNITNRPYRPYQFTSYGDPCRMPGDFIKVEATDLITNEKFAFKSYILSVRSVGIQKLMDTYTARGDISNPTYSDYRSGTQYDAFSPQSFGYRQSGGGGTGGESVGTNADNSIVVEGISSSDLIEYLRNVGFRFPKEPTKVKAVFDREAGTVVINWKDPTDLEDEKPAKSIWAGTVVVRKEKSIPKHRWDGTLIVDSTTRNQYQTTALIDDNSVKADTEYYYGIFPYDTKGDYRYTKVVKVKTEKINAAPEILDITGGTAADWDGSEIAILWSGQNNSLTVKIVNNEYVFTMISGETVIYSWTSSAGTTPAHAKRFHVAFLEDNDDEIAKPSFIYHTGTTTYSYNLENPTDEQMAAIYLWLHPES